MPTITLTPARAALLKAVGDGEVKHHTRSTPSDSFDAWNGKKVTKVVEWLRDAGLIAKGPKEHASFFAPKPWELTEAGEQWLAENPVES